MTFICLVLVDVVVEMMDEMRFKFLYPSHTGMC